MIPVERVRFITNPISAAVPTGNVDLVYDPAQRTFVQQNPDGSTTALGDQEPGRVRGVTKFDFTGKGWVDSGHTAHKVCSLGVPVSSIQAGSVLKIFGRVSYMEAWEDPPTPTPTILGWALNRGSLPENPADGFITVMGTTIDPANGVTKETREWFVTGKLGAPITDEDGLNYYPLVLDSLEASLAVQSRTSGETTEAAWSAIPLSQGSIYFHGKYDKELVFCVLVGNGVSAFSSGSAFIYYDLEISVEPPTA